MPNLAESFSGTPFNTTNIGKMLGQPTLKPDGENWFVPNWTVAYLIDIAFSVYLRSTTAANDESKQTESRI